MRGDIWGCSPRRGLQRASDRRPRALPPKLRNSPRWSFDCNVYWMRTSADLAVGVSLPNHSGGRPGACDAWAGPCLGDDTNGLALWCPLPTSELGQGVNHLTKRCDVRGVRAPRTPKLEAPCVGSASTIPTVEQDPDSPVRAPSRLRPRGTSPACGHPDAGSWPPRSDRLAQPHVRDQPHRLGERCCRRRSGASQTLTLEPRPQRPL